MTTEFTEGTESLRLCVLCVLCGQSGFDYLLGDDTDHLEDFVRVAPFVVIP